MANLIKRTWVDGESVDAQKMNTISSDLDSLNNGKIEKPASEGAADQVLHTDGAGDTYWGEGGGAWGTITGDISDQTDLTEVVSPLINQWDEQYEDGSYNSSTGAKVSSKNNRRNVNPIAIKPSTTYYCGFVVYRYYYDANMNFLSVDNTGTLTFITPNNAYYMNLRQEKTEWTEGLKFSVNYPSTYTGYYPSALPKTNAHVGMLGNVIGMRGWNQLMPTTSEQASSQGVSIVSNGDGSFTVNGTSTAAFQLTLIDNLNSIKNHKVFARLNTSQIKSNAGIFVQAWGPGTEKRERGTDNGIIVQCTSPTTYRLSLDFASGVTFNNVVIRPQLHDLTAMGLDSINTPEEFRALFPNDYYPYASGSWADLLWENASPTSAFAAQTVNLDLSPYSFLVITFKTRNDRERFVPVLAPVGVSLTCPMFDIGMSTELMCRSVDSGAGYISFQEGNHGKTAGNIYCIPIRIYGIK